MLIELLFSEPAHTVAKQAKKENHAVGGTRSLLAFHIRLRRSQDHDVLLDELISRTIGPQSSFKRNLRNTSRSIQDAAYTFSPELGRAVFERLLQLDDQVSDWFDSSQWISPGDPRPSLFVLLTESQVEVLSSLRNFEFENWG
jgi:hypothetical protein